MEDQVFDVVVSIANTNTPSPKLLAAALDLISRFSRKQDRPGKYLCDPFYAYMKSIIIDDRAFVDEQH